MNSLLHRHSLQAIIINNALFQSARTIPGAILAILILSNGVSIKVFTLAKSLQLLTSALLTIPAGMLADKFGRKIAIMVACISEILYFLMLYNPTNLNVIVGEILNGIGLCFYAGAYEGWLLDLNKEDHSSKFKNNILKSNELVYLFMIVASILGAILGKLALLLTAAFLTISMIIFILIPDNEKHYSQVSTTISLISNSTKYLVTHRMGILVLCAGTIYTGLMQFIFQFWQPFFLTIGIQQHLYFGTIFSFTILSQYIILYLLRKYVYHRLPLIYCLCLSLAIASISMLTLVLLLADKSNIAITIFLYFAFNGFMSASSSLIGIIAAKNIQKRYHATGISIIDFTGRALGAILLLFIVPLIKIENIKYFWLFLSFIFLFSSLVIYVTFMRKKNTPPPLGTSQLSYKSKCLFCGIVNNSVKSYIIWQDQNFMAFLTPYPNTKGFTIVIPKQHYPSYIFKVPEQVMDELMRAAKNVANLLEHKLNSSRCAIIFEGYGVNHLHAKLIPLQGIKSKGWVPINGRPENPKYFNNYEGYISSHDGPEWTDEQLTKLVNEIIAK